MTAPPRYRAKRDEGEAADVATLERIGALVWKLHTPCDLLVHYRGCLYMVDRKNPELAHRSDKNKTTDLQREAVARGWPIRFYESTEELIEIVTGHPHPSKIRTTYRNKPQ